jgi:hypothetical protein
LGELLGLRWARVDLQDQRIRVTETLVDVEGRIHFGPPKTKASIRSDVVRARSAAERAGAKAQQQTLEAVKALTDLGLSRRDAAELLGPSHQRVHQLLEAS